tara:strand:- start:1334 stop:3199 length:1866 start_codon:yes stop_codon:yes gene_type:complete
MNKNASPAPVGQSPADNKKLKEMFGKLQQNKQRELKAVEEINKQLDKIQPQAEKIKDSLLKRHKKDILGVVISMRPAPTPAGGAEPQSNKLLPNLLVVSELKGKTNKQKIEHITTIEREGNALVKGGDLRVSSILLEEVWDFATRGQYNILRNMVMGRIIHDKGDWIKSLKAVELHKMKMLRKFEKYVVTYVMAGSLIRGEAREDSDIDVSIVIDDTDVTRTTSNELVLRLRDISTKFARESEREAGIRGKLNIQVWILTRFWEGLKRAEPVFYTTLRDAVPLYDRGMFAPWKLMLKKGLLTPSPEAIQKYLKDGRAYLNRTNLKFRDISVEDFFWSTSLPIQGLLMLVGTPPGSPNHLAGQMRKDLVKPGLIEDKYVKIWENILKTRKDIEHGKLKEVTPEKVTKLYHGADELLKRVEKAYGDVERKKVSEKVKKISEQVKEDVQLVLKVAGVKASKKGLDNALKSELVDRGLARSTYLDLVKNAQNIDEKLATLAEAESLMFGLDKIRDETINIINAEKGLNKDKYKITLKYGAGERQKMAILWLFGEEAFLIKDSSGSSKIVKYIIDKKGRLTNEKESSLKVLENKLSTFEGGQTRITSRTINSLKDILDDNLQLMIG